MKRNGIELKIHRSGQRSWRAALWSVAGMSLMCLPLMSLSSGCVAFVTQMRDLRDDTAIAHKNRRLAKEAWYAVCGAYAGTPCLEDFECGFRTGYCDVADGKNGCPPAVPPRKYWRAKYLGETGVLQVEQWFEGYRHGVSVAQQDGIVNIRRIPTTVPPDVFKEQVVVLPVDEIIPLPAGAAYVPEPVAPLPEAPQPEAPLSEAAPSPAP